MHKSLADNISQIWEIYNVNNIDELVESFSIHKNLAFYKKSEKLKNDQVNIFAWIKLAQWQVKSEIVGKFQPQSKEQILSELKTLFHNNSNVIAKTKSILNKYGIKFLIIEKFKQSPIDGYSLWSIDNPAIVITLRKKNLDNFAFTVMHELGHVFEHLQPNHNEDFLDVESHTMVYPEKEIEADNFAKDSFMNEADWEAFLKQNLKFDYQSTEGNITKFAESINLHPSIVLGRYCYEKKQFAIKTNIERTIN
jgi:HTH-type transcriptional regulator / antitoxin HigA